MAVWVYSIAQDLPRNWDIAVKNRLWASPHARQVTAGDLLVFRLPVGNRGGVPHSKIVGIAWASGNGRTVEPQDDLPWDDRYDKNGALVRDKQKISLTDIRTVTGVEVSWPTMSTALKLTTPNLPDGPDLDEHEALQAISTLLTDDPSPLGRRSTFAVTASSLYRPGSQLFFGNCTDRRADEFLSTGSFEVDAAEWNFDGRAPAGSIIIDLDEDERIVSAWILHLDLEDEHNWKRTDTYRSNRAWTVDELCQEAGLPRADSYPEGQTESLLAALDRLSSQQPSTTREEGHARTSQCRRRDATLAFKRKQRDDWRCQGCDRRPEDEYGSVKARRALHSHHLRPMAVPDDPNRGGLRYTSTDDLISLCANCHSFAHSEEQPLTLEQLRAALITPAPFTGPGSTADERRPRP